MQPPHPWIGLIPISSEVVKPFHARYPLIDDGLGQLTIRVQTANVAVMYSQFLPLTVEKPCLWTEATKGRATRSGNAVMLSEETECRNIRRVVGFIRARAFEKTPHGAHYSFTYKRQVTADP